MANVRLTTDHIDSLLVGIEISLQKVDATQGSLVKRTKAELDLLAKLEGARDSAATILKSGDRALLQEIFGGDCTRIARLRAAVNAVRLSKMNRNDQRLPTCEKMVSSVESLLKEQEKLGTKLAEAEAKWQRDLLHRRACLIVCPSPEQQVLIQADANDKVDGDDESGLSDNSDEEPPAEASPPVAAAPVAAAPAAAKPAAAAGYETEAVAVAGPEIDAETKALFASIDKNGDGRVTKTELKQAIKVNPGLKKTLKIPSFKAAAQFLDNADADKSGSMDMEEFQAYLSKIREVAPTEVITVDEATVRAVFDAMDKDGKGSLDVQALKLAYVGILLSTGQMVSRKRVARWAVRNLKKHDADGNKSLDAEEFRGLVNRSGAFKK